MQASSPCTTSHHNNHHGDDGIDNQQQLHNNDDSNNGSSGNIASPTAAQQQIMDVTFSADCHPISCTRCRKLHKKCNRKLGGCSKCLALGLECVYNSPQKRGKGSEMYSKNSKTKNQSSNKSSSRSSSGKMMVANNSSGDDLSTNTDAATNPQISTSNLPKLCPLSPNQVVEIYFTFMCGIHPLIERGKLVYFVKYYLPLFENKSCEVEQLKPNEWIKTMAELRCIYAFYLGILTLSSQLMGELDYVDHVLRKVEIEIAALSVDYVNQFYWGATCHLLFMGWLAEGNQLKANYYHTLVNFYLENETNLRGDKFFKSLLHHKTLVSARFMKDLDCMENLLDNMYQLFFYSVNKKLDEFLLPGTFEYMKNTKITPQNYVLFKQVSHFIFKALSKFKNETMKTLYDCHCENFYKQQRLFTTILSEGYAFLFLKQITEVSYSMMEESALRITLLTENEMFPYCTFAVISSITEACLFHLNVCKMVERGLKPRKANILTSSGQTITFDCFSILEKDLRAITILSKRYRRVGKMFKDKMDEMTQVLNRNSLYDTTTPFSLTSRRELTGGISSSSSSLSSTPNECASSNSGASHDMQVPQHDEVLLSVLKQLTQEEESNSSSCPSTTLSSSAAGGGEEAPLTPWDEIFAMDVNIITDQLLFR